MSNGDLWQMPGGHVGLEMSGSTRDVLRLAIIVAGWPYPAPPKEVARSLCERLPSRYGAAPPEDAGQQSEDQ